MLFRSLKLIEVPCDDKNRKFKCPKCGRLIKSKKIDDPQKELEIRQNKEKHLEEYKKWLEDSLRNTKDTYE